MTDVNGVEHGTDDQWEQVGQTLDWVAALLPAHLGREPADLLWPVLLLGLGGGLAAEALTAASGSHPGLVLVGVTLTLSGFGMLGLLARRFRSSANGGARTAETAMLAPWLRRLQVLMAAVLVAVFGLLVLGAVMGSVLLVARNLLEVVRVGSVVLVLSWLLLDDEVGLPDWLARRVAARAHASR